LVLQARLTCCFEHLGGDGHRGVDGVADDLYEGLSGEGLDGGGARVGKGGSNRQGHMCQPPLLGPGAGAGVVTQAGIPLPPRSHPLLPVFPSRPPRLPNPTCLPLSPPPPTPAPPPTHLGAVLGAGSVLTPQHPPYQPPPALPCIPLPPTTHTLSPHPPTWGQYLAQAATRFFTMPALMLNRSSRVMPGLRGTPAGMTTRSHPVRHASSSASPV
jgi:hypothetical protein